MSDDYEIFIKFLPQSATEREVKDFFADCGPIVGDARLMWDNATGLCKGVGWLSFKTEDGFRNALGMDKAEYLDSGRHIAVSSATKTMRGGGWVSGTVQAAGTHTPAMFQEVLANVVQNKSGIYIDGTFGRGGHTKGILKQLNPDGQVHAFDLDPEAITVGKAFMKVTDELRPPPPPLPLLQPSHILLCRALGGQTVHDPPRPFRSNGRGPVENRREGGWHFARFGDLFSAI